MGWLKSRFWDCSGGDCPIFLLNNTALIYILRVILGAETSSIIVCLETVVKCLYELCSNFFKKFCMCDVSNNVSLPMERRHLFLVWFLVDIIFGFSMNGSHKSQYKQNF